MNWWLLTIPFISAFIHWITIWMALKLLFHPRQPKNILGLKIQGIFPKKQQQIAESLGRIVGQELLSFDDIQYKISNPENVKKILPHVEEHIDHFLREKLKEAMPMVSMFIGDKTILQLKTVFMKELEALFPVILSKYADNLRSELDLEKMVVQKISGFSSDRLESMLNQILTKEFRFIEVIGTILGFLIGLLQIAISVFF